MAMRRKIVAALLAGLGLWAITQVAAAQVAPSLAEHGKDKDFSIQLGPEMTVLTLAQRQALGFQFGPPDGYLGVHERKGTYSFLCLRKATQIVQLPTHRAPTDWVGTWLSSPPRMDAPLSWKTEQIRTGTHLIATILEAGLLGRYRITFSMVCSWSITASGIPAERARSARSCREPSLASVPEPVESLRAAR